MVNGESLGWRERLVLLVLMEPRGRRATRGRRGTKERKEKLD